MIPVPTLLPSVTISSIAGSDSVYSERRSGRMEVQDAFGKQEAGREGQRKDQRGSLCMQLCLSVAEGDRG